MKVFRDRSTEIARDDN